MNSTCRCCTVPRSLDIITYLSLNTLGLIVLNGLLWYGYCISTVIGPESTQFYNIIFHITMSSYSTVMNTHVCL